MNEAAAHPDYFISRNGAGKTAAEQIACIIREAGLTPFYQDEDFRHADFMRMMEEGYEKAAKLIVLLSEKYQQSEHCREEYNAFLAKDPGNLNKRVIVFRISDCAPVEMLTTLAYTDLAPVLADQDALRQTVREALGIDERTPVCQPDLLACAGQQIRHPFIREVKGFTGRDEMLDALSKKLAAKSSAAIRSQITLAMRGVGGAGKTVLAQEYAWRNRERYCGVWWIRAGAPETLMDDLAALGARFIPGISDMKPEDAALKTLDQLAQMPTAKPWLLIYDNAEGPGLPRKVTPAGNAHVLITTRRADWFGETDEELAVEMFDRDTAIAYLAAQAHDGDADAAGRLADALNCLPLALSHARAYCWARFWSFGRYIAKLPELIAQPPKDAPCPAPVFATFSLAIENAAKECADAETLMALLAFFAPDRIPLWLIPEDVLPGKQRDGALAALASVSLAAFDLSDGTPEVSVHRLVQDAMLGRLRSLGRFEDAAALAIRLIATAYDASDAFASAPRNAAWLPHALAAHAPAPSSGPAAWHTLWTLIQIGDFRVSRGELGPARTAYEGGLAIAERLAAADPDNAGWQRNLSVAHERVGDVLVAQDQFEGALAAYRDGLSIAERLAAADPGNAEWQRDLSVSYEKVGDVLVDQGQLADALALYRDGLRLRERLAAADPANAEWQRDLFVSSIKAGDVLVAQDQLDDALAAYRGGLSIAERLAGADHANAGRASDDGGNAQDQLAMALAAYRDSLATSERRAVTDLASAGWQRDPSDDRDDVLAAQDRLARALAAYSDSLTGQAPPAGADPANPVEADPVNAGWQRDLSVAYERVGNVLAAQGQLDDALAAFRIGLSIAERLAEADPGNAEWQRDLSVSYNKVGDVLVAQGQLEDALAAYRSGLAIAERFAAADPAHAGWQRDLSVSYDRVGNVLVVQGRLEDALAAYRDSLRLFERLVKADPANTGWQVDVAFAYSRLARHGDKPKENWRKVVDILQRLDDQGRLAPTHKKSLGQAKEQLAALGK